MSSRPTVTGGHATGSGARVSGPVFTCAVRSGGVARAAGGHRYARTVTLTDSALSDALDPSRLPRHTAPARYDLELEPDLAAATFHGRVDIAVRTVDDSEAVVLNAI